MIIRPSKLKLFQLLVCLLITTSVIHKLDAQTVVYSANLDFDWKKEASFIRVQDEQSTDIWTSSLTDFDSKHVCLPNFNKIIDVPGPGYLKVHLSNQVYSTNIIVDRNNFSLQNEIKPHAEISQSGRSYLGQIHFTPFINENGSISRLDACNIKVEYYRTNRGAVKKPPLTYTSVLSEGDIFKISVSKSGIYKINSSQLEEIGINPSSVDIRNLHLYGNGGGKIKEVISEARADDLIENPILIVGGEDGRLDASDAIYFYGEGPDVWESTSTGVNYIENPYSDLNFYYLKVDGNRGLRLSQEEDPGQVDRQSSVYSSYQRYENDRINLMGDFALTEGTGQQWFGEYFNSVRTQNFEDEFNFDDIMLEDEVGVKVRMAVRSKSTSNVNLQIGDSDFNNTVSRVNGDADFPYANISNFNQSILLQNDRPVISIDFPSNGDVSEAWLDFIELRMQKGFNWNLASFVFSDKDSKNFATSSFSTEVPPSFKVWNITNPTIPKELSNNNLAYKTQGIEQIFIAWNESGVMAASPVGEVENQNLHSIDDVEMLVVYYKDFKPAVDKFVDHRKQQSGLNILTVDIDKVSEEFGSGKKDPGALRDFLKMVHDRTDKFKYLLIVGDASYDFRHLDEQLEDQNFVPTYETPTSLDPIFDFPTDDFYALLSDNEGGDLKGALDIAVGRLPVKTLQEANNVINKIISYDGKNFGDWRIRQGWAADDEDSSGHFRQSDDVQRGVESKYPVMNHKMIYYDAFKQESTPGGARYPDATNAINENIFNGMLVFNYLGHGGPKGWAQERVLQISDIQKWDNPDKLPLLVTATCTFTGFDDPALVSGGEECILKADGGVIGLMTTVRPVFSNDNKRLVDAVFDTIFSKKNGLQPTFGDIIVNAKNRNVLDTTTENARKFVLIGDPSQRIAIPLHKISITSINGKEPNSASRDTINALQEVTIEGFVGDENNNLISDFNGVVFPTVFDKQSTLNLLNNDPTSQPGNFDVYSNIVFKGSATVVNGRFSFTFVVPADINYSVGEGRISLYAHNGEVDAAGYDNRILIGGGSGLNVNDDEGPEIDLFMNDEAFVYGGITNTSPILLAKLADDLGINVSGSSIGHDLTAVLDDNSQETYILNDFYEAEQDNYQRGTVRFPLKDIATGKHTLKVKAWDTSNNSNEAIIDFVVVDQNNTGLEHVLNYPNPFTDNTAFHFEHDLEGSVLDVLINIYTISGKLVKTIQETKLTTGFRVDDIVWDGKDDFGSKIGKGVYLYKIKVDASELNQSRESEFSKLVILK